MKSWYAETSFVEKELRRSWNQFPSTILVGERCLELFLVREYCAAIFEVFGGTALSLGEYLQKKEKCEKNTAKKLIEITDNGNNAKGYFLGEYNGQVSALDNWNGILIMLDDNQLIARKSESEHFICFKNELNDRERTPNYVKKLLSVYTSDDASRLVRRIAFSEFDKSKIGLK